MASPKVGAQGGSKPSDSLAAVPTVYIVTSNRSMRASLQGMVSGLGYAAKSFRDAESFLSQFRPRPHSCLILDLDLPGMSGLQLLERLQEMAAELPAIAIGESYDISLAVAAMRLGAVDYFEKPFVDHMLIARLEETIL